mgnify:CR=1 FL=1
MYPKFQMILSVGNLSETSREHVPDHVSPIGEERAGGKTRREARPPVMDCGAESREIRVRGSRASIHVCAKFQNSIVGAQSEKLLTQGQPPRFFDFSLQSEKAKNEKAPKHPPKNKENNTNTPKTNS